MCRHNGTVSISCKSCDQRKVVKRWFIIVFLAALVYTIGWLATLKYQETWFDCEKIVKVEPVGHKYETSYVVTGSSGRIQEVDTPVQVGRDNCFNRRSDYSIKPFIGWWR